MLYCLEILKIYFITQVCVNCKQSIIQQKVTYTLSQKTVILCFVPLLIITLMVILWKKSKGLSFTVSPLQVISSMTYFFPVILLTQSLKQGFQTSPQCSKHQYTRKGLNLTSTLFSKLLYHIQVLFIIGLCIPQNNSIHRLSSKYILSIYHILGTVLDAEGKMVIRIESPFQGQSHFSQLTYS